MYFTDFQLDQYKNGGIYIKPKNRGKFNALKKRTGKTTEQLTHSKNPLTRKRAIFAKNAAKWNKKQAGGYSDETFNVLAPTIKMYAEQYGLSPEMLMSNLYAEGTKYGFNDILNQHAGQNAVKYTDRIVTPELMRNYGTVYQQHPQSEMMTVYKSYPISGAEHAGLDVSKETIEKLIEKGKLDKSILDRMTFQETTLDKGVKKSTAYFKNMNDMFQTAAAVLDRKRTQAKTLASQNNFDVSDPNALDFWTYVAYNGGAGTADKMMKDFKKKGLDRDNQYLDAAINSPWQKAKTNASSRLANQSGFEFSNIPAGVMLPGATIKGKSTAIPKREYPVNYNSNQVKPDNTSLDFKGVPTEGYDFFGDFGVARRTDMPVPVTQHTQDQPGYVPIQPTGSPIDFIPGIPMSVPRGIANRAIRPFSMTQPGWVEMPFKAFDASVKPVLTNQVKKNAGKNWNPTFNQGTRGSRSTTPDYWGGPGYKMGGVVNKYQSGGDGAFNGQYGIGNIPKTVEHRQWVANWLEDPASKERAANYGINNLSDYTQGPRTYPIHFRVKPAPLIAPAGYYGDDKYPLGSYDPGQKEVTMYVNPTTITQVPGRTPREFNSTLIHELSHSTELDQFFQQRAPKTTIDPKIQDYFNTGEAWPRIMEIRYNLGKKPGEQINNADLNKAKEMLPNNLMWRAYDDSEILDMLNKWVSNDARSLPIAQAGKNVNDPFYNSSKDLYYDQGTLPDNVTVTAKRPQWLVDTKNYEKNNNVKFSTDEVDYLRKVKREYLSLDDFKKIVDSRKSYLEDEAIHDPKKIRFYNSWNPKKWGKKDYSDYSSFNSAFRNAREANEKQFVYNKKRYNTDLIPENESNNYLESKEFVKEIYANPSAYTGNPDDYRTGFRPNDFIKEVEGHDWLSYYDYFKNSPIYNHEEWKDLSYKEYMKKQKEYDKQQDYLDSLMPDIYLEKNRDAYNKWYGKKVAQGHLDRIDHPMYFSITNQKPKDLMSDGYYDQGLNRMFINSKTKPGEISTTSVHELSHKADDINELINPTPDINVNKLSSELVNNYSSKYIVDYLMDPTEIQSRKLATLFYLKEKGRNYSKITKDDLKQLYTETKMSNFPYDIKQLLLLYENQQDDLLKYLNNDFSYLNNKK